MTKAAPQDESSPSVTPAANAQSGGGLALIRAALNDQSLQAFTIWEAHRMAMEQREAWRLYQAELNAFRKRDGT